MTSFRKPRRGDRQISSKLLGAMIDEENRLGKFSSSTGVSSGPAGICLPNLGDDVEGCKLVFANWLPGAFGGPSNGYANISSYPAYETTGNFVGNNKPNSTRKTRKVYPQDCTVWKVKSDQLEESSETIKVVNLGSYTHPPGWYLVAPVGDDLFTVISELGGQRAITAVWTDDESSLGYPGIHSLEAKFIRGQISSDQQTPSSVNIRNWAHVDHNYKDLFIHGPGVYELTYGVEAYVNIWDVDNINAKPGLPIGAVYVDSPPRTGGASSGAAHYHTMPIVETLEQPLPFSVHLVQNFNGQASPITWDAAPGGYWNNELPLVIPAGIAGLSATGVMGEKTVIRTQALDHGNGPGTVWNRFSLLVSTYSFATIPYGKRASVGIRRAWIHARIVDENYYSPGYNAFTGAKTSGNPDGYQWWGGGPAPNKFDRDGTIITT